MAIKNFDELIAGADKIRLNELPESNSHLLVGEQLLDMANKQKEENALRIKGTTEYNVSVQHPTSGINGTNIYTLETAIAIVPANYRSLGLKLSFLGEEGQLEKWEWQGGNFADATKWLGVISEYELIKIDGGNKTINNVVQFQDYYIKLYAGETITSIGDYDGKVYLYSESKGDVPFASLQKSDLPYTLPQTAIRIRGDVSGGNIELYINGKIQRIENNINGLYSKVETISDINFLPYPYVSPYKYGGINSKFDGFTDKYNNEYIECVKFSALANSINAFTEISTAGFNISYKGVAYMRVMVRSSVPNVVRFVVFTSNTKYYDRQNIQLENNKWTPLVLPVTIDSTSDRINIRFDIATACEFSFAKPGLSPSVSDTTYIRNFYKDCGRLYNGNLNTLKKGKNLYKGVETVGSYLDAVGGIVYDSSWCISSPIVVKQGERYTINKEHNIVGYDIDGNISFVHRPTNIFGVSTITIPFGISYIKCNVRIDFVNNFIINQGITATEDDNFEISGTLIKDKSITKCKLSDDIPIEIPDKSIILDKLSNSLISYFANGENLQNKTVTLDKLANDITNYFLNGGNISEGTITQNKLNTTLIQFIEASGGGTITNNADGITIKINGSNQLYVDLSAFGVFVTNENETTQSVISRIAAYNGKATLIIKNDLTIDNNYTIFPNNLYKVIGAGGKVIPYGEVSSYKYLKFTIGTVFECGQYQMFDKWVIVTCDNGFFRGIALTDWWGCAKDGVTDCNTAMSAFTGSSFKDLRWTKGTYVAYPSNGISGRTLYMDKGVIIDGVFHIAYGDYTNKTFCCDTKVVGKVVSTLRVGGAMIDGLEVSDGIKILAINTDYVNQTKEGGCKGVHFNFTNKNVNIGDIDIEQLIPLTSGGNPIITYGLGIDIAEGYEKTNNIHIKSLKCGPNTSSYYDLMITDGCHNIRIDDFQSEGGSSLQNSILISGCKDIALKNCAINFNNPNGCATFISGCDNIDIYKISVMSEAGKGNWGVMCNSSSNVFISNITTKNQKQGLRLINGTIILIINHKSISDITPVAQSGSEYKVLNSFVL